jgi:hypothetical protein
VPSYPKPIQNNWCNAKNLGHFFAAIAKQRPNILSGVNMVQRIVSVPFSSMRSIIDPPPKAAFRLESAGEMAEAMPGSVPAPRFTPMPEQDLTVWGPSLLIEAILRTTRELMMPRQLRAIRIRKRDRA